METNYKKLIHCAKPKQDVFVGLFQPGAGHPFVVSETKFSPATHRKSLLRIISMKPETKPSALKAGTQWGSNRGRKACESWGEAGQEGEAEG